ncbi:MAG: phenylalanine--tRNA ligase subunit beta, partial [Ignavibacteria bacterium]
EVKYPELNFQDNGEAIESLASVEIEDAQGCPRYSATVVTGVKIKESPDWLKEKLVAVGLRPINNVVDVTNFILYELGQPLHAFDLDKLAGRKIVVKKAGDVKKFVTLDSKERELSPDDLMICDGEKPVAVAGVMGGENSEVTDDTVNVLIESAYFNPSRIRKISKRLGLSTDSSYRFERGCNPEGTLFAAKRAAQLIAELGEGTIAKGVIDVYPEPMQRRKVTLRYARITKVLGFEISVEEVHGILKGLGFELTEIDPEKLEVEVPLFRHDIEREIDLIEEVARIYGYNKIPLVEEINIPLKPKIDQSEYRDEVRAILTGLGFNEILTNSMLNQERASEFGKSIPVLSPQSSEMSNLRTSLIPGMLLTISRNLKVKEQDLKLFEIGHIFKGINDQINSFDDFSEEEHLLMAVTGKKNIDTWYGKGEEFDIYDIKGDVEAFLNKMNIKRTDKDLIVLEKDEHFEFSLIKQNKKKEIGRGGKLNKTLLNKYDINQDVFIFDFNLGELVNLPRNPRSYSPVLRFPKVIRDFAFVLDKSVNYSDVIKSIRQGSSNLLKNITLFDIFESESLGQGKKSMAFQLEYYDESRTLTEEEIDKDFWNAIERVKKDLNAQLRG